MYSFNCISIKLAVILKTIKPLNLFQWLDNQKGLMYRFESLYGRNIHEGDSREIQDQAVEVHSGDIDACRKI